MISKKRYRCLKVESIMDNKEFGYVRVSSKDQNEARQLNSVYAPGIDERDIHIDKQSV